MLLFSQRRKLALLFEDWRKKEPEVGIAASCPENVVAFLCSEGLINEEKAREFLNANQPKIKK